MNLNLIIYQLATYGYLYITLWVWTCISHVKNICQILMCTTALLINWLIVLSLFRVTIQATWQDNPMWQTHSLNHAYIDKRIKIISTFLLFLHLQLQRCIKDGNLFKFFEKKKMHFRWCLLYTFAESVETCVTVPWKININNWPKHWFNQNLLDLFHLEFLKL